MNGQNHERKMEKWLESPDARNVLSWVTRSVMKYASSKNLSLTFLRQDISWYDANDEDFREDVRSELVLFILENRPKIQNILVLGKRNSHYYLRRAFINHWIEKTRRPLMDPRRYLHKHAADVLRASENFHTFVGRGRSLGFSAVAEHISIPPLSAEDIREISFPEQSLEYEYINKKKVLLQLAVYFLNQVSKMWGDKPVGVDLRDFISWLGLHVSVQAPVLLRLVSDGKELLPLVPDHRPAADGICFDPVLVKKWAWNFANRLSEKERAVFLLRHGHNLSLKDIAGKLGYKGSSGPKYPLDCAERKLKFFLCDLPWLSPDDLNKEAFSLFRDMLLLNIKNIKNK